MIEKRGSQQFVDDLRKELVFNRMQIAEANKEFALLRDKTSSRDKEIEALRDHLIKRDAAERCLVEEFDRQILLKNKELSRLKAMLSDESLQREKVSHKLISVVDERKTDSAIEEKKLKKLSAELSGKNSMIADLKQQLQKKDEELLVQHNRMRGINKTDKTALHHIDFLKKQLAARDRGIEAIRNTFSKREGAEHASKEEFDRHVAFKDEEITRLKALVNEKTEANIRLGSTLDKRFDMDDDKLNDLRKKLLEKDKESEKIYVELTQQIAKKDEEIRSLRRLATPRPVTEDFSERLITKDKEITHLREQISERDRINSKLSQQINVQLTQMREEVGKLKNIIIERDAIKNKLVSDYEQQLSQKEIDMRQLKTDIKNSRREVDTEKVNLKVELKELANKQLLKDLSKLKDEEGLLRRKLKEQEKTVSVQLKDKNELFADQEMRYKELITLSRKKSEERIKQLIKDHAEREIALKSDVEMMSSKIVEQETLLAEKDQKIDEAIKEFSIKSSALLGIKSGKRKDVPELKEKLLKEKEAGLERREEALAHKEEEVMDLVTQTDDRISEISRREEETSIKEEILLREQETLKKELELLERTGIEIGQAREEVADQKEEVAEQREELAVVQPAEPAAPEPTEVMEETPIQSIQKPSKLMETKLAKEKPKVLKPKQAVKVKKGSKAVKPSARLRAAPKPKTAFDEEKQKHIKEAEELFSGEREGLSELDEITSVVDIAIEQGDSMDRIRNSLLSAGYSKENIEKALSMIKKVA